MKHHLIILALNLVVVSTIFSKEDNIISIKNEKEFDQLLEKATKPIAAQFHSGCSVCNTTRRHLKDLAPKYPNVHFVEIDINDLPKLAERYTIVALPTVLIFAPKNKKPQYTIMGPNQKNLTSKLNKILEALNQK
jgi:thiol-disulfide isomerase/thioredoxin